MKYFLKIEDITLRKISFDNECIYDMKIYGIS